MTKEQRIIMLIDAIFGEESKGDSVNIVRNALEKQIPIKAYKNRLEYTCPICGACVGKNHTDGHKTRKPYCFDCGQAIDWSDDV